MKIFRRTSGVLLLVITFLVFAGIGTAQAGPVIKFGDESWLMINYEMQLYLQSRDTGSGSSEATVPPRTYTFGETGSPS